MNKETSIISAIIINSKPFRENDRQVVVYGREGGKLLLKMRGALRAESKLIGQVQPFSLSTLMVVPGRGGEYIGGAKNIDPYLNIRDSLNKIALAGKSFFVFNHIISYNQKDEALFDFLKSFLDFLEDSILVIDKNNFSLYHLAFVLKLLKMQGYKLNLYNCIVHGERIKEHEAGYYFNFNKSGVCCQQIDEKEDNLEINVNVLKILRFLEERSFLEISKIVVAKSDLKLVTELLRKYLLYHFLSNFSQGDDKELIRLFSY